MSIQMGKWMFEGPYALTETWRLENRAGVYVILCPVVQNKYSAIDVGESVQVKNRLETHDRKDCWKRNCSGTLQVAILYTPHLQPAERSAIEQEIRKQHEPSCGKR
jgi:hypothetical protein